MAIPLARSAEARITSGHVSCSRNGTPSLLPAGHPSRERLGSRPPAPLSRGRFAVARGIRVEGRGNEGQTRTLSPARLFIREERTRSRTQAGHRDHADRDERAEGAGELRRSVGATRDRVSTRRGQEYAQLPEVPSQRGGGNCQPRRPRLVGPARDLGQLAGQGGRVHDCPAPPARAELRPGRSCAARLRRI